MKQIRKKVLLLVAGVLIMTAGFASRSYAMEDQKSTIECLQMLKEMNANQFVDASEQNITKQQYDEIKVKALELTAKFEKDADKIKVLYDWVGTSMGSEPAKLEEGQTVNDPYAMFRYRRGDAKSGVCQGYANLLRTMLSMVGIPNVIAHGNYVDGVTMPLGHAWNFVYCDGQWGVADAAMYTYQMEDPSKAYPNYETYFLESNFFKDDVFDYGYYHGLAITGFHGKEPEVIIPEKYGKYDVVCVDVMAFQKDDIAARKIVFPKTIQYFGEGHTPFFSQSLNYFEVAQDNPYFSGYKGIIYDKEGKTIRYIPFGIVSVELKAMDTLEKNTLYNMSKMKYLKIGEGTKTLSGDAFEKCPSLEQVFIPDSVKTIDDRAFAECGAFTAYVKKGSVAEAFAEKQGYPVEDPENFNQAARTKIDQALNSVPKDLSTYTTESVEQLEKAIEIAKKPYTLAEQEEADASAEAVLQAIKSLKTKKIESPNPPSILPPIPKETSTEMPAFEQPGTEAPVDEKLQQIAKVTGLKVSYKKNSAIVLTWKKNNSSDRYEVFRKSGNKWIRVRKNLKNNRITIKKGAAKKYDYKVRAYRTVNNKKVYGKYSVKIQVKKKK